MNIRLLIKSLTLWFCALNCCAWNLQGHQVVAQIAYDHLTPSAKNMCQDYLNVHSKNSLNRSFVAAAVWMDVIKFKNIHWYDAYHYISLPYSNDGSSLPAVEKTNIVRGINNALSILETKKGKLADKRLALLILIHLMGDIHQPLHAISKVSKQQPQGDSGGNSFRLGFNEAGTNLHKYWDNGAGFFLGPRGMKQIKNKARALEHQWPCSSVKTQKDPLQWARDSHELAINQVYRINSKEKPDKEYQSNALNIIQRQSLIAGCRLSCLLNKIAKTSGYGALPLS